MYLVIKMLSGRLILISMSRYMSIWQNIYVRFWLCHKDKIEDFFLEGNFLNVDIPHFY